MKLMLRYTMKNKKLLIMNFICVFGFILIELGLPTLLARMIDIGIVNNDADYVKKIGFAMIGIVIVGIIMNILLGYFTTRITTNMTAD
ncbi:MAG TPA: ABC transporter ATP-binding protein, partial [Enterococcus sp.]|nr:ABC transporter ATP-binding protein [Enterococcus sp.]